VSVEYRQHPAHLEVVITGDYSTASALVVLDEIREQAVQSGHTSILADVTGTTGAFSSFDRYELGSKLVELFHGRYKIVTVELAKRINKMVENVAVNRGVNYFITDNREAALGWLLDQ